MSREWIAVGVVIATSAAFVLGWSVLRNEPQPTPASTTPPAEDARDGSESPSVTPETERSPVPLRHDEARLRARLDEVNDRFEPDTSNANDALDSVPTSARPPFQSDLLSSELRARFLAPRQWTEEERAKFGDAHLLLEVETGVFGQLRFVGRQDDGLLSGSLTKVAEALLINRYELSWLSDLFVTEEQDRGRFVVFESESEANDPRAPVGPVGIGGLHGFDSDNFVVVRAESEFRRIDLRPLRRLPQYQELEQAYREAVAEARRLDPSIFGADVGFFH